MSTNDPTAMPPKLCVTEENVMFCGGAVAVTTTIGEVDPG